MRKSIVYLMVACFLILGIGCSKSTIAPKEDINQLKKEIQPTNSGSADQKNKEDEISVTLYFSDKNADKLKEEKREIDKSEVINKLEETIVNELIKGPQNSSELLATIPQNTQLLSLSRNNETVLINFSKEFVENHPGGSSSETLTIFSIVNTLTEIKEVEKVEFLVEGKKLKEFKGHYEFDKPFTRNEEIINRL